MRLRQLEKGTRAAAREGFTLMELLVVVAILLILVGVATPMYMSYLEKSKRDTAKSQAMMLATNLKEFALSHGGEYPPVGDWSLIPLPPEKQPPLDPWNMPYQWTLREVASFDAVIMDPLVWSAGPNKTDENGGGDDITNVSP